MGKTVVVLGANSFSGQDFVDLLLDDSQNRVIGISRSEERSALFLKYRRRTDLSRYQYVRMDMNRDMPALLDLLDREQPSHIVNFAAQSEVAPSWEHPEHWYQTNCVALAVLVNHLRRRSYLDKYLQVSSPEVYGTCSGVVREDAPLNPTTPYAASKAAADMLLDTYHRQYGFPLVTVRATNVYGSGQQLFKIIPRSSIYVRLGRTIQLHGGGTTVKSYIHVRDVSCGELDILNNGRLGHRYHLSPDHGMAIRDVVGAICDQIGVSFDEVTDSVAERPGQDASYVIDSTLARETLGWRPRIPLTDGISEVVRWVNGNWEAIAAQPLEYQHRA